MAESPSSQPKVYDFHRLRDNFKDAVGRLPTYKRSMAWEYVTALQAQIAALEDNLREREKYTTSIRRNEG